MVRIIIKGGVWKVCRFISLPLSLSHHLSQNTEDEVLKAAIAKYGKNQWYPFLFFLACSALLTSFPPGLEYLLCLFGKHLNNAKQDGTNGLTLR
jgi:hypothetical protein